MPGMSGVEILKSWRDAGRTHPVLILTARELAELYGGSVTPGEAALGGVRAELTLPARALPPAA